MILNHISFHDLLQSMYHCKDFDSNIDNIGCLFSSTPLNIATIHIHYLKITVSPVGGGWLCGQLFWFTGGQLFSQLNLDEKWVPHIIFRWSCFTVAPTEHWLKSGELLGEQLECSYFFLPPWSYRTPKNWTIEDDWTSVMQKRWFLDSMLGCETPRIPASIRSSLWIFICHWHPGWVLASQDLCYIFET